MPACSGSTSAAAWTSGRPTEATCSLADASRLVPETCNSLWLRAGGAQAWEYDVMLMDATRDLWTYRRDSRVSAPLDQILWTKEGVDYLRPEIQLLHKAPGHRAKDQWDFEATRPLLTATDTRWLRTALETAHPGHPWIGDLP